MLAGNSDMRPSGAPHSLGLARKGARMGARMKHGWLLEDTFIPFQTHHCPS